VQQGVAALIVLVTWRGSFVLLGLVSLLWVVVWVWYFRDDPRQHRGVTEAELAKLPVQDLTKAKPRVPWGRLTLRMLPVTITYFCYGWSFWLFITWLPSFFKDHYNLDLKNAALFSSAVFFAGGRYFGGHHQRRDPTAHWRSPVGTSQCNRRSDGRRRHLPRPRVHDRQFDTGRLLPGQRVLLPRARDWPDMVDPDGHRAAICRGRARG
jgi:Major Facilitator Superfamily